MYIFYKSKSNIFKTCFVGGDYLHQLHDCIITTYRHASYRCDTDSLFYFRYCPKRLHFTFDNYVMRSRLAVLDHNFHVGREEMKTASGDTIASGQWSRKTKKWVAYPKLCEKTYGYITGTMFFCNKM